MADDNEPLKSLPNINEDDWIMGSQRTHALATGIDRDLVEELWLIWKSACERERVNPGSDFEHGQYRDQEGRPYPVVDPEKDEPPVSS